MLGTNKSHRGSATLVTHKTYLFRPALILLMTSLGEQLSISPLSLNNNRLPPQAPALKEVYQKLEEQYGDRRKVATQKGGRDPHKREVIVRTPHLKNQHGMLMEG